MIQIFEVGPGMINTRGMTSTRLAVPCEFVSAHWTKSGVA